MKLTKLIVIVLYLLNTTISESTQFGKKYKKSHKKTQSLPNDDLGGITDQIRDIVASTQKTDAEDVADVPIYLEGWIKYIHYRDNLTGDKPKSFFRNDEFFKQRMSPSELKKKDSVIIK